MSYRVLLHPKAAEFLEKADVSLKGRIKARLKELEDSPEEKDQCLKPGRKRTKNRMRKIFSSFITFHLKGAYSSLARMRVPKLILDVIEMSLTSFFWK